MELLGLTAFKDRMVGAVDDAGGISPCQRKILSIGVELVANCPILFLDEPTSGLDAVNASMVMRCVRSVANTGRTVIMTVHQPSQELFCMFDNLLLMQLGGWQVFFGPLGHNACNLVQYLHVRSECA